MLEKQIFAVTFGTIFDKFSTLDHKEYVPQGAILHSKIATKAGLQGVCSRSCHAIADSFVASLERAIYKTRFLNVGWQLEV